MSVARLRVLALVHRHLVPPDTVLSEIAPRPSWEEMSPRAAPLTP